MSEESNVIEPTSTKDFLDLAKSMGYKGGYGKELLEFYTMQTKTLHHLTIMAAIVSSQGTGALLGGVLSLDRHTVQRDCGIAVRTNITEFGDLVVSTRVDLKHEEHREQPKMITLPGRA